MGQPLAPLPEDFGATVASLHRVAEAIVAPARKPDNEISLRATPGGFGTPEFDHAGARDRVRVEGDELVRETAGAQTRAPLGSLAAAAALVADLLPGGAPADEPLTVGREAALALGRWYAFGEACLARLRDEASVAEGATHPLLWPEHFDIAIELGDEAAGRRATFGFSPGDENHAEPYVYVAPWAPQPAGERWNARGFAGAELGYAELLAGGDPEFDALRFLRDRRDAL
ncbi:MAG: hypothetical protein U0R71_13840 [Solirubrobacterales bacterium]